MIQPTTQPLDEAQKRLLQHVKSIQTANRETFVRRDQQAQSTEPPTR